MKQNSVNAIAFDISAGFMAFVLVLFVAVLLHTIHNVPFFLLGTSVLLFLAGCVRALAKPLHPLLNGVMVGGGAIVPVLLLGTALHLLAFGLKSSVAVLSVIGVCAAGAQARSWWKAGWPFAAVTISTFLLTAIFLVGKFALPSLAASTTSEAVNRPAPNFTLTTLDGRPVSLDSLAGHVVVLDFWGTWCAPCLAEMPTFHSIYDRYRTNPDVVFLMVNSGLNGDTPEKVQSFVKKRHLRIPVALDKARMAEDVGAMVLPSLIVLDKHGNIRMQDSGYRDAESLGQKLTQEIDVLLKDK